MPDLFDIELEPEVRVWLESLPPEQYAKAEAAADFRQSERRRSESRIRGTYAARPASFGSTCIAVK